MEKLFKLYIQRYGSKPGIRLAKHKVETWVAGKPGPNFNALFPFINVCIKYVP